MSDWFRGIAQKAAAVTPGDTGHLEQPAFLYIGGNGNVKVDTVGGDTVTFTGVVAGTTLPVIVVRVYSTDTTATNMVACW